MQSSGVGNSIEQRISNIEANMASVARRVSCSETVLPFSIQLVCFGPSLRRTWGLIDRTKPIVTVSGAHDFLRERDIIPTYHIEFDWRPHKARHVSDPKDTLFWLASCVHPDLVNKISNPSLWHAEQSLEEIKFIRQREAGAWFVTGGSSAGLRALELLHAIGYRRFDIFGMDSSFEETGWAGMHYGAGSKNIIELPYAGRKFKTSPAFLMYADQFRHCRKIHPESVFNLHGDGLLQTMIKQEMAA